MTLYGLTLAVHSMYMYMSTVFPRVVPMATNYFRAKKYGYYSSSGEKKEKITTTGFKPETF